MNNQSHKSRWWRNPIVLLVSSLAVIGLAFRNLDLLPDGTMGPQLIEQTWPAGTFLSHFPEGDRINTYHRNYLMIAGQEGTGIWDISNPTDPTRLNFNGAGNNGHRWYKIGDLYWREYSVPEVDGTAYRYLDLSNMLDLKPVTESNVLHTVLQGNPRLDKLETFPHTIEAGSVFDMRTGETMGDLPVTINKPDIVLRIGNYVYYVPQSGEISVFDIGDPLNVKFLGSFGGDIPHEQYSTGIQLWRNYLVYMSGNESENNLVAFDISDPTNVVHGFNVSSDDITLGRYMIFQDEFGFTGRFDRGVKYNFEEMRVEQEFFPPSTDETLQFLDNQWMPIGNVVVASGDGKTSIFSHQDGLDKRPPTVGFHFPRQGDINQPVTSTLGFVINETINDLTLNDTNIQVSPIGGDPIEGDISSTSYQVVNYAPKQPLLPNTTYEVKFVEGGVKDAVGNGIEEYVFYFTTGGDASNQSPVTAGIDIDITSPFLAGNSVGLTVTASDPDGNDLIYNWDFGDGTPKTGWTNSSTQHTYTEAGNYHVQVQVSDQNGGFTVDSRSVSVVEAQPISRPTQSGPIAVDELNRIVWVVNPDNNTLSKIDADALTLLGEYSTGNDPVNVAIDSDGEVWVTCRDDDAVQVFNQNGALLKSIQLHRGSAPYGIVFSPVSNQGFVSEFGSGQLVEVDGLTNSLTNEVSLGSTPRALSLNGDGSELLVTRFISSGNEGQVWQINTSNLNLLNTISLPLDATTVDNGNKARGLPNYVASVSIHPYNNTGWTVAKKDNILRGKSRDGNSLTFDNAVRTAIVQLDLNLGVETLSNRIDIDNHGQPSFAQFSPSGNHLFLTMQGNNHLIVIDPKTGLELMKTEVGLAPQGIAIDSETGKVFVKNFMDRTVSVFDGDALMKNGDVGLNELTTISTVSQESLLSEVLLGKQVFYNAADIRMGTDGYISCASCHIDGTEDGRVWDFTDRGEGLRNTISLKGRAGTGHGRVHWSANFDEIQDFENDIRGHFNGEGFLSDAAFSDGTTSLPLGDPKAGKSVELDAIAAYLESLTEVEKSPWKSNDGTLTSEAIAGKTIFQNLNCQSCHGGTEFTDSNSGRLHDVGSINAASGNRLGGELSGIDVPTLKGVWATPPYLHDGSAETITEVFGINGAHGNTDQLTTNELDQLVAYLMQIDEEEIMLASGMTLEISSPLNGSKINASGPVTLSVNTDILGITAVEYFVDNQLVEEVLQAPFESVWEPVIWKEYSVMAKVYYNGGLTASVTPESKIIYKDQIEIMFVVGSKNLTSEDQLIKSRLEKNFGFQIDLWEDIDLGSPTDANPYDMVIISSSVEPAILGNDLESAVVPILTWEPFMFNRLRMTSGAINSGFGFTESGYQQVDLTNQSHPLAAGISSVTAELYPIVQSMPYGVPEDDAIVIASVGTLPILFGYDIGSSAGSRRVAFPLRDQFMHLLTGQGWQLFDAAVIWTLHGGDSITPVAPLPDISFTSPLDGELVNTPLNVSFDTENWDIPSSEYKLRFRIDGSDRGLVLSDEPFVDGTALSEGPHVLTLQMERSNNFPLDLTDTIIVNVTNEPLPQGPTAIIEYPFNGALVAPTFDLEFSTFKWDLEPNGKSLTYSIDGVLLGSVFNYDNIAIDSLPDGEHSITLSLIDELGVPINSETTTSFTVDQRASNLPESPFFLEYFDNSSSINTAEVKPVFNIVNDSSGAVNLNDFKIRYWYTLEHSEPLQFNVDYSAITGVEAVHGESLDGQQYFEVSLDNTGTIAPNNESGIVQFRIHHAGYLTQDQSNDYSYDPAITSKQANIKTTLYYQGNLVWGLEPTESDPPNQSPQIVLTSSSLTGSIPHEVQFDASQSFDSDGTIVSYNWDFGDGNIAVGALASHTYTVAGTYLLNLEVIDDLGAISSSSLNVSVIDPNINNEPTASFITDVEGGVAPLDIQFDASGSSDPDGDVLSFIWDFGDGDTTTGVFVSHQYQSSGSYIAQLTVTDTEGASSIISKEIVVSDVVNLPPLASMTASQISGIAPLIVSFDASGSSDPEGAELSASWDFGDGTNASGLLVDYIYAVAGTYNAILTISDGVLSDSDTVTLTVVNDSGNCDFNTPLSSPLPSITNSQYDYTYVVGSGGPDVSSWTNVTVNWNLSNNGLYQFSVQTNNGQPGWWNDLRDFMTWDWASPNPSVTFTSSGFPGLDGEYWVAEDGGNFVMVSKTGGYSIYCSNETNPPICTTSNAREVAEEPDYDQSDIAIYPSITQNVLEVRGLNAELERSSIVDASGKQINANFNIKDGEEAYLDVSKLKPGMYFLRVQKAGRLINFRFIKR